MSINKRCILYFGIFCLLFTKANAQHVLPIFSGIWFDDASIKETDACSIYVLEYKNQFKGDAKSAADYISNPPARSDCEWKDVEMSADPRFSPLYFIGSYKDWDSIASTQTEAIPSRWYRSCLNSKGEEEGYLQGIINPLYICPPGSKRSVEGISPYGMLAYGCTTTPRPCVADVVGRDLSSTGFGRLGHTALFDYWDSTGDRILEVLEDPKDGFGIYSHTLESFKKADDYWGSKYELPNTPNLTFEIAKNIINVGKFQRHYPFTYTMGWDWHAGSDKTHYIYNQNIYGWEKITTHTGALFRCDSFVYYAYLEGAKISIVKQFERPVSPRTIWNAFAKIRDSAQLISNVDHKASNLNVVTSESSISNMLLSNNIDIAELDKATESYDKNIAIPHSVKLKFLWDLALIHKNNPNKLNYIISCLGYLKPLELTNEFIQLFGDLTNVNNQHLILSILINSAAGYDKDPKYITESELKNIVIIQNFVRELIFKANNKELLKYAVQMYPSLVSPDVARVVTQEIINRPENLNLFNEKEKTLMEINSVFSSQKQMQLYLPSLLNNSSKMNALEVCFKLQKIDPALLNDKNKKLLRKFLSDKKSLLTEKVNSDGINDGITCDLSIVNLHLR